MMGSLDSRDNNNFAGTHQNQIPQEKIDKMVQILNKLGYCYLRYHGATYIKDGQCAARLCCCFSIDTYGALLAYVDVENYDVKYGTETRGNPNEYTN